MDLRKLWYFLVAASAGGVSAGARQLGLAQSTVSGALSSLEASLGAALFESTSVGSRLTPPAIRLRDYAAWLTLEAEQAFLNLYTGRIDQPEQVAVFLHGIPRGSIVDWATMRGALSSASGGGPRASITTYDDDHGADRRKDEKGLVLRYRLAPPGEARCDETIVVEDSWRLLALRDPLYDGTAVDWNSLADVRLALPPMIGEIGLALSLPGSRKPEIAALDPAGVPYTVERKDSALLVPAGCLPSGFSSLGLRVTEVWGVPLVPVLEIGAGISRGLGQKRLTRAIRDEIAKVASGGETPPIQLRTLSARVDLHTFRCFAATVETGSTAQAAQACFIVQPALSGQIRKLERALARQLFVRSHAGMAPTPAGRRLYGMIAPLLNDHLTALERLREGRWSGRSTGRVRLGIIPAANENSLIAEASSEALAAWRSGYPSTSVSVAEGYTSVLVRWLRTHLIDLAIIDSLENHPGIRVAPIFREPVALVFAPGSAWDTGEKTIGSRQLTGGKLALASRRFGIRSLVDHAFAAAGTRIAPSLEVDSMAIALRLVATDGWATILPPSAVYNQLNKGLLKRRLLIDPIIERRICAAVRQKSNVSPETRALVDLLVAAFQTRPHGPDVIPYPARTLRV